MWVILAPHMITATALLLALTKQGCATQVNIWSSQVNVPLMADVQSSFTSTAGSTAIYGAAFNGSHWFFNNVLGMEEAKQYTAGHQDGDAPENVRRFSQGRGGDSQAPAILGRKEWPHAIPKAWSAADGCPAPEGAESWSQSKEDQDLYNFFFCGARAGTFVEMGALDGKRFSNTKFFEDHMGWAGALIEAAPPSVEQLRQNRPSPKNKIFGEGVCQEGAHHMDFIVGDGEPATNSEPGAMTQKWVDHYTGGRYEVVSVPCRPFGDMLRETLQHTGADHIDFVSLDVEGGELKVLQTMDWDVDVKVWLIEMELKNKTTKDDDLRLLLASHGYVRSPLSRSPWQALSTFAKVFASDRNEVFVRPDSPDSPSE